MINKKKISFREGFVYPLSEKRRIEALKSYQILDSSPENDYDEITFLASKVFKCPISFISFIDEDRLWLKSNKGFMSYEMERELSFCEHTILDEDLLIVNDTLEDERFFDNPFVVGSPYVRFYAAAPIISAMGYKIGTLCIMDNKTNKLSESEKLYLKYLANRVVRLLELRRKKILLAKLSKESVVKYKKFFMQNNQNFYQDKLNLYNEISLDSNVFEVSKKLSFVNLKSMSVSSQNQTVNNVNIYYYNEDIKNVHQIFGKKFKKTTNVFKFFEKNCVYEQYQKISIYEFIIGILKFYQEKMKSYEIQLNVTLEIYSNFIIACKPFATMQAFLCLLNNSIQAIKYKKYKWIHINLKELAHDIEISVSDNSLRLDRSIAGNQNPNSVLDLEDLQTDNIHFLNELIYAQGGQVLLDSTVDNTKILFYLPKRSSCRNN